MIGGTQRLLNIMRREATRVVRNYMRPDETGVVDSYDPETHAVKMKIQPYGHLTGWIPLGTSHVGDNYGFLIGPRPGDQFKIGFTNGDRSVPYIKGRVFSDDQKPPKVESGEFLQRTMVKDGSGNKKFSQLFMDKDDNTTFTHSTGASVKWDKDGNTTLTGPTGKNNKVTLTKDGKITKDVGNGISMTLDPDVGFTFNFGGTKVTMDKDGHVKHDDRNIGKDHKHGGVEPGAGNTGDPEA